MSEARYAELRDRLSELWDLAKLGALAGWDQQTMMPPQGAAVRARQFATISKIVHEQVVSEELGELLEELRPYEESLDYDSDEASLIRVARRDREKEVNVPVELREARGPGVGGGLPGLGRGAADERLRALPSLPRAQCRASPRVRLLLRGRRALRRFARRLRAGDEDGRGARGLRAPAGRAHPADRRGLRARNRRLVSPPRAVPGRSPAGARPVHSRTLRLPRGQRGGSIRSSIPSPRRWRRTTSG